MRRNHDAAGISTHGRKRMTTLFYILAYLAVIGFVATAAIKVKGYLAASPLHVRWELYPVPHEGPKGSYGGSFMEETDWWTKPRHIDHMGDLKALLEEVLFLHATFTHNLKLWFRTYPFHFGLYMLMGGTIILVVAAFLRLFGMNPDGGFLTFVHNVINAISLLGMFGIIGGGIGLICRRLHDEGLRKYSTPEHFFNLGVFIVFALVGLVAWAFNPSFARMSGDFIYNLLTFNFADINSTTFVIHMLFGFFVLIWIPMTHMGHLLFKYFTYHDIRWGDTPTDFSQKNNEKMKQALQFKVSWAADHINGQGTKTWLDIATESPKKD